MKYHQITHENDKRIPESVVIVIMPKEKIIAWYYYHESKKTFYSDRVNVCDEFTDEIVKEIIDLIVLEQINKYELP